MSWAWERDERFQLGSSRGGPQSGPGTTPGAETICPQMGRQPHRPAVHPHPSTTTHRTRALTGSEHPPTYSDPEARGHTVTLRDTRAHGAIELSHGAQGAHGRSEAAELSGHQAPSPRLSFPCVTSQTRACAPSFPIPSCQAPPPTLETSWFSAGETSLRRSRLLAGLLSPDLRRKPPDSSESTGFPKPHNLSILFISFFFFPSKEINLSCFLTD